MVTQRLRAKTLDTEAAVRSALSEIAPWASPDSEVQECKVVQVRKHLGKRMAFVGLAVKDRDGHEQRSDIVLKPDFDRCYANALVSGLVLRSVVTTTP